MKTWLITLMLVLLTGAAFADPMPDFRLPNEMDKNVTLQDLLGKGPVLLDFWADYCQPCKLAMPKLHELAEKYDTLTVVLVSVDAPKMQSKAKNFLKSKNYKFITLFDPEKVLAKKLNVGNPPHTFIFDSQGEIAWSHIGYQPGMEAEYENQILRLLTPDTPVESEAPQPSEVMPCH